MSSKTGDKSAKSQLKPKAKADPSEKNLVVTTPVKDKRKTNYTKPWAEPVTLAVGGGPGAGSNSARRTESKDEKKPSARSKSKNASEKGGDTATKKASKKQSDKKASPGGKKT